MPVIRVRMAPRFGGGSLLVLAFSASEASRAEYWGITTAEFGIVPHPPL